MSDYGPAGRSQPDRQIPTQPTGESIACYDTYLEAQAAVDYLSDHNFPVHHVTIVGSGLRMVERVTGRLSYGRVAVAGALSGAWFGLFVGMILVLLGTTGPQGIISTVAFGAAFGILYGLISYKLTGGRRDFTSNSQIVASEYQVLCQREHVAQARDLLHEFHSGASGDAAAAAATASAVGGVPGPALDPQPGAADPEPPATGGGPASEQALDPPQETGDGGDSSTQPEEPQPEPSGPTYGEMIAKQREQQREREAAARAKALAAQTDARLDQSGGHPDSAASQSDSASAQHPVTKPAETHDPGAR